MYEFIYCYSSYNFSIYMKCIKYRIYLSWYYYLTLFIFLKKYYKYNYYYYYYKPTVIYQL